MSYATPPHSHFEEFMEFLYDIYHSGVRCTKYSCGTAQIYFKELVEKGKNICSK